VVGSVTTSQGVVTSGNNPGDTTVSVNIGTIPAHSSVIVSFLVSINDPLPLNIERIANQGYVSSNELPPEFTDDSDTPLEDDSTSTAIGVTDIDLSDYSHDYGGIPAGDCSPWTLLVCNVGTAALTVYSIESDNPSFIVDSPSFPQTIAPSGCIDVVLTYCATTDCCCDEATITITSNDPDEEILTVALRGHGISPDISGKVLYYSNSAPIKDVTITLSGGESSTTTTYSTGFYLFQNLYSGLDYTVTPSKTNTEIEPSISAYDAALLLQHIIGSDTLSEYQQIAGDASGNEGLTSYDASLILQYGAYIVEHFPANDWSFVPESRSYTPLVSDQHNQNYIGILTGDVSGNWSSSKKAITLAPIVSVWVPDTACTPGDTVIFPIYVSNVTELGVISASITLTFDANAVRAFDASLGDIVSSDWLIQSNAKPGGEIIIAMAGAVPLGGTGKLVTIPFVIDLTAGMDVTIHIERCQFNEGGIRTDLQDGKISIVTGIEEYSDKTIPVTYEFSQNVPNPVTNDITTISYGLPTESNVSLEIYNLTGQLIQTLVNEKQKPGRYAVCWDGKDNTGKSVAPGVYFYCIKAGAYKLTKKMVLLR